MDSFILGTGWHARVSPSDHPVSQYEFDVLIGADGKRNTLLGNFKMQLYVILSYFSYFLHKHIVNWVENTLKHE